MNMWLFKSKSVMSRGLITFWMAACTVVLSAQPTPKGASLDLVLERSEGGSWRALNPETVLEKGNTIRFRLVSSFSGYLYVYYRGSDGEAAWLYPSETSGANNRIEGGAPRLIPSEETSYVVSGKPGFDIVYWLISSKPLAAPDLRPPVEKSPVPRTMVPRCGEPKAVTSCLDNRAGAKAAEAGSTEAGGLKARELTLKAEGSTTHIAAAEGPGLLVYEFRIAHR
jgi:hypothetical protein